MQDPLKKIEMLQREYKSLVVFALFILSVCVFLGGLTMSFVLPIMLNGSCQDYNFWEAQVSYRVFGNSALDADHDGVACE